MSCIIDNFIKKSGHYNYAYVVMIIGNNKYANPAIIFSYSLRKLGCLSDLVALVDKHIDSQTIKLLKSYYNVIIQIDSIDINHFDLAQRVILSKIHAFNLIEYNKIFLIDVDTIFFSNPDKFLIETDINDYNSIYMVDLDNYGFILFHPSKNTYLKCKKIISKYKKKISESEKPFEYVLKKIYNPSNTKKINFKISYDSYSNVDCIQYRKDKPFLMKSAYTIEKRQKLEHFKVWFSFLTNIINKYPEIKEYKCIEESIEISKYFLASMSRFILDFVKSNHNSKLKNIINLYGPNNYSNYNYYHLDINREYTNKFIKYNIDTFDLKYFLKYIDSIHTTKYKLFTEYYKYESTKELIKKLKNNNKELLYTFLNFFIKIYLNVIVVMEINCDKKINNGKIPDLENNLVYSEQFEFDLNTIKNIIFNLFQNFTYNQRIKYINKNIKKNNYYVRISIYELIAPINNYDLNSNLNLFIFNEQSSKIRLSSMFFNKNTIEKINSVDYLNIFNNYKKEIEQLNLNQLKNLIDFQSIKKFIYGTYSGNEINNLCLSININNEDAKINKDRIKFRFTLIDNNKHMKNKINSINSNKIFYLQIIFTHSLQNKQDLYMGKYNIIDMNDPNKYFEIEGIKIFI